MNNSFKRLSAWVMALVMAFSIMGAFPAQAADRLLWPGDYVGYSYSYDYEEDVPYLPEVVTPGALDFVPALVQPFSGGPSADEAWFHDFYLGGTPGYDLGEWEGRFGEDGFILFEYNHSISYLENNHNYNASVAVTLPRNSSMDISSLPSYVDSMTIDNESVHVGQGWFGQDWVLHRPGGGSRMLAGLSQADMNDSLDITFELDTTEERIVTLYVVGDVRNNWFTILDLDGDVILDGANQPHNGRMYLYADDRIYPEVGNVNLWRGYVSFAVRGGGFTISFRSNRDGPGMNGARTDYAAFNRICAIFFDTPFNPSATSARFHDFYLGGTPSYDLGEWEGRFGEDGFILFEYNYAISYLENNHNYNASVAINLPRDPSMDINSLPSYVQGMTIANESVHIGQGWFGQPWVLHRPGGGQRMLAGLAQADMNDSLDITFELDSTDERIVTLYIVGDVRNNWFTIRDLDGDVILTGANQNIGGRMYLYADDRIYPEVGNVDLWRGYVSFAVRGGGFTISFRSNRDGPGMNGARTDYAAFNRICAIFFDTPPIPSATSARFSGFYLGGTPGYDLGEWEGRFGEDGFILFEYNYTISYLENNHNYNAGVAINLPRDPNMDISNLPSYVQSMAIANESVYIGQGWFGQPWVLHRPGGGQRMLAGLSQADMNDSLDITFELDATDERIVTLFIVGDVRNNWFTILDLDGDVILTGANQPHNGRMYLYADDRIYPEVGNVDLWRGYVSFAVSGGGFTISFRSNRDGPGMNGVRTDYAAFNRICAIFFDTAPVVVDRDWLEIAIDPATNAPILTWPDLGNFFNTIILERSVRDIPETFTQIAVINAPTTQFIDLDPALISGREYFYRARFIWNDEISEFSYTVSETIPPAAAISNPTAFLGYEMATGARNWVGVYGGLGYVILGAAKVFQPCGPCLAAPFPACQFPDGWVGSWRDFDPNYLPEIDPVNDHFIAPGMAFLDPAVPPGPFTVLQGNRLIFSPDPADARTLERPPSSPTGPVRVTRLEGRANAPLSVRFNVTDNTPRIFTFYTIGANAAFTAQILDASYNIVASQHFEARHLIDGGFVSFMVSGPFTLRIPEGGSMVSGFFFDAPAAVAPPNPTAVAANPGRDITVSWGTSTPNRTIVLERSTNNINFEPIAEFPSGAANSFLDENLTPGQTYFYRLRYAFDVRDYSVASDTTEATVPDMAPSFIQIITADEEIYLGDTVTVTARLVQLDASDNLVPIANQSVNFRLTGPNVGDGLSVGQAIPETIGAVNTDSNGYAVITFTPAFAGTFGVVAFTLPNDTTQVDGAASNTMGLIVNPTFANVAPTIFRVSDAVAPGHLISINGSDFNDNSDLVVFIQQDTTGTTPANTSGATQLEIIQRDRYGQFLVARMPAGATPGVYTLWVQNETGLSAPVRLNAARALHISDYEIFPGIEITVVGRNFAGSEFGAADNVAVRLNGGAGIQAADLISFTPFSTVFTVSESVPLGSYFVEVSNDGGNNWSRTTSGQTLTVVAGNQETDDPLNLGVAWARDFNWTNEICVTDFGAIPDSGVNVTALVQAAINAARDSGGGVVFFPKGEYQITSLVLPSHVVLLGECREHTILMHVGGSSTFISSAHWAGYVGAINRQGVARLSLLLSDEEMRPDAFMWLGENWGDSFGNAHLRQANRIFVYDVMQDYKFGAPTAPGSGRGIGIGFIAHERVLIKGNYFSGHMACIYMTAVSQYYWVRGNRFEYTRGQIHSMARFFFAEGNTLLGRPYVNAAGNFVSYSMHGIMARDSSFMANNYIARMGDRTNMNNEGEAICVEVPAGYHNLGQVLGVTSTSITVAAERPLIWPRIEYGVLSIAIINGRGMGQIRPVASISGSTIVVTEPFAVDPDQTSRFTLISPLDGTTMINNIVHDNAKGLWLFGNSFDGVIADNISVDSEGIFVWTNGNRHSGVVPGYGNRIARNLVEGSSWRSGAGGIGFNTGRSSQDFFSTDIFGFEVIDNVVIGRDNPRFNPSLPNADTEAPTISGIYGWATLKASQFDGIDGMRDAVNIIIFGNHLANLSHGIHLSRSTYGAVLMQNTFSNVDNFINHYLRNINVIGTDIYGANIVESGNVVGTRAASPPTYINPTFVITTCLDDAVVGQAYEMPLVSRGYTPITWVLVSGSLPAGLTLGADGVISGIPTESGIFTIIVTANNGTFPAFRRLTITVEPCCDCEDDCTCDICDCGTECKCPEPDCDCDDCTCVDCECADNCQCPVPGCECDSSGNCECVDCDCDCSECGAPLPTQPPGRPTPTPAPWPTPISTPGPTATTATPTPTPTCCRSVIEISLLLNPLLNQPEHLVTIAAGDGMVLELEGITVNLPNELFEHYFTAEGEETEGEHLLLEITIRPPHEDDEGLTVVEINITQGDDAVVLDAPIIVEVCMCRTGLDLDYVNTARIVALLEDGSLIGGWFDPESGMFIFEISVLGTFVITYVPSLRRIGLQIGSYTITDLIDNMIVSDWPVVDRSPVIRENSALVPLRFVAYALDATVYWDDGNVTIVRETRQLTFAIGEIAPGMDVPAIIMNNRTMVPLRFIAEFFDAIVMWDDATHSIEIIMK